MEVSIFSLLFVICCEVVLIFVIVVGGIIDGWGLVVVLVLGVEVVWCGIWFFVSEEVYVYLEYKVWVVMVIVGDIIWIILFGLEMLG